jgi:hypothetical protein
MQSHLPPLAYRNPITQILIQEHLVTLTNQPLVQLTGTLTVLAGMTDEYPGHRPSSRQCKKSISDGVSRKSAKLPRHPGSGQAGNGR